MVNYLDAKQPAPAAADEFPVYIFTGVCVSFVLSGVGFYVKQFFDEILQDYYSSSSSNKNREYDEKYDEFNVLHHMWPDVFRNKVHDLKTKGDLSKKALVSASQILNESQTLLSSYKKALIAYEASPENYSSLLGEKLKFNIENQKIQIEKDREHYIKAHTENLGINLFTELAKQGHCMRILASLDTPYDWCGHYKKDDWSGGYKLIRGFRDLDRYFKDPADKSLTYEKVLTEELNNVKAQIDDLHAHHTKLGIFQPEDQKIVCENIQNFYALCKVEKQNQSLVDWLVFKKPTSCGKYEELKTKYDEYQIHWKDNLMKLYAWKGVLEQPRECQDYTKDYCSMKGTVYEYLNFEWKCHVDGN